MIPNLFLCNSPLLERGCPAELIFVRDLTTRSLKARKRSGKEFDTPEQEKAAYRALKQRKKESLRKRNK
jgi:hypothetical protein